MQNYRKTIFLLFTLSNLFFSSFYAAQEKDAHKNFYDLLGSSDSEEEYQNTIIQPKEKIEKQDDVLSLAKRIQDIHQEKSIFHHFTHPLGQKARHILNEKKVQEILLSSFPSLENKHIKKTDVSNFIHLISEEKIQKGGFKNYQKFIASIIFFSNNDGFDNWFRRTIADGLYFSDAIDKELQAYIPNLPASKQRTQCVHGHIYELFVASRIANLCKEINLDPTAIQLSVITHEDDGRDLEWDIVVGPLYFEVKNILQVPYKNGFSKSTEDIFKKNQQWCLENIQKDQESIEYSVSKLPDGCSYILISGQQLAKDFNSFLKKNHIAYAELLINQNQEINGSEFNKLIRPQLKSILEEPCENS
jgi:hypothetical protein